MARPDLAVEGGGTVVPSSRRLGVVGPVSPTGNGDRRRRAPVATDPELGAVAREWAEQTALAQGFPPVVSDPTVVHEVAILLTSGCHPVMSGAPHGLDTGGIEPIATAQGRLDEDPGQNGDDDRTLSGRIEACPLLSEHPGSSYKSVERRGA